MNNEGLLTESVHLSHWTVLSPLNKGILLFSSLPSSLPFLSQISPVISPVDYKSPHLSTVDLCMSWERFGRDMGEIKIISTMPNRL